MRHTFLSSAHGDAYNKLPCGMSGYPSAAAACVWMFSCVRSPHVWWVLRCRPASTPYQNPWTPLHLQTDECLFNTSWCPLYLPPLFAERPPTVAQHSRRRTLMALLRLRVGKLQYLSLSVFLACTSQQKHALIMCVSVGKMWGDVVCGYVFVAPSLSSLLSPCMCSCIHSVAV